MIDVFRLEGPILEGVFAVEASAGTGKTYSLTGLVARHVAERGLRADQLLMVTFTRAATAEMRDRTRAACRSLLGVLEAGPQVRADLGADPWMIETASRDEAENARRAENLRSFLSAYDEATITTIHGFCQHVLGRAGLSSPALGDVTVLADAADSISQVISDVLIGPLSEHPDMFTESSSDKDMPIGTFVKTLKKIVKVAMSNPSAARIPSIVAVDPAGDLMSLALEDRWAVIVDHVIRVVHERRRASAVFGYDDLIHSVVAMLLGRDGGRIARSLRDQYRLVLIDEFQDTDSGQWTIFDRAFIASSTDDDASRSPENSSAVSVGIVGDPKQAIYRFRGADIDAYRSAVAGIDQHVELTTNFRSNSKLVSAVNDLFEGVTFGDESISYRQVSARSSPASEGVEGCEPVEIRFVPYSSAAGSSPPSRLTKSEREEQENGLLDKWNQNTDMALELVFADMAMSIADLIESGSMIDKKGVRRDVRPGDIAVLVRAHDHAERIRNVFAAAGIPAVRYRARSVFESPAALEWKVFLAALAAPSRIDRVRAAALSVFGRSSLGSFLDVDDDDAGVEEWQRRCAEWSADVARVGLSAVYFRLRSDQSFMTRVVGEVEGERLLTDLDHIAEVLASAPELARGAGPADCLQVLERLIDDADEEDEFQRRIESDAESVHIATIHHSKGLEFPIVYLPTLMKMIPGNETPLVFSSDGRRVIDVATPVEWTWDEESFPARDDRKAASEADITGDLMRMLYVAVTRAEQRVVLYWTPLRSAAASSLGRLLFASRTSGRLDMDPEAGVPDKGVLPKSNREMRAVLHEIAARSEHIRVVDVEPRTVSLRDLSRERRFSDSAGVASFTRTEPVRRPGWGKWSYSGIASTLGTVHAAMAEPFLPGADEGRGRISAGSTQTTTKSILFPDHLYGAVFGNRIHAVYEAVDPSNPDLERMIEREVRMHLGRRSESSTVDSLVRAIAASCRTPLGPMFAGADLSSISAGDRLAEMVFDMRISDSPIHVARIGELMLRHLEPGDPFAEYGASLIDRASRLRMAGFVYGEVDAVFRIRRPDGSWSAVVSDYKTNLLHDSAFSDPLDAYRRENLQRTMADDHYVLQAIIYQVALHRYLRWRVSDYRPHEHLGGIAYLFVRGLVGPDAPMSSSGEPTGVFTWRPPTSLIEALDAEFAA